MPRYEYDPNGTAYSDGRRDGYAAGFAAALAMLREPSEELIAAVKKPISNTIGMGEDEDWTARAALAAAADAMGAGLTPSPEAPLPG